MVACENSMITVSTEQPTISKHNERHDWVVVERGGVLEGVAAEKITRNPDA